MSETDASKMSALEARDAIARGSLSAAALARSCLERIDAMEPEVGAFACLDRDLVMRAAEALDAAHEGSRGPLRGVPVGLKDIIDTADMPTENGTPLDRGRRPSEDATIVKRLREAGALLIGKTVTTELGSMHPRGTRNPHDPARTPGGSSSGSAAAVAAGMLPLAIGTQTVGSVIRPASFCGVVGFKPSFGLIPRGGVLPQAPPLDTIGVFARSLEDAALLVDVLAGRDSEDDASIERPATALLDAARSEPASAPKLAFVRTPFWESADPAARESLASLVASLGQSAEDAALPPDFARAPDIIHIITRVGIARHYRPYLERGADQLSDFMRGAIAEGLKISAADYLAALDMQKSLAASLDPLFGRYDAIVAPAAPGEAPSIETTGNPIFNGIWTLCGVPAVTLPLLEGQNGLPIGVQVIGRRGEDGRLLRSAAWLAQRFVNRA